MFCSGPEAAADVGTLGLDLSCDALRIFGIDAYAAVRNGLSARSDTAFIPL